MTDAPITREELHHRRIDMRGYRRSDGLYEVEATVVDRKTQAFEPLMGGKQVAVGEPLHDMGVAIVFDTQMQVHEVRTFTLSAPYDICPEGGRALQSLVGLRMTAGWNKEVRDRLGGSKSCTHLRELLGPLATTAFQTTSALRRSQPTPVDARGRPLKIDSCYAYGAERELVRMHWPQFHRSADDARQDSGAMDLPRMPGEA
jgi:Protein of unknown function (DUF2889)